MRGNNRLQAQALTAKNGPTSPRLVSVVAIVVHSRSLHREGRPVRKGLRHRSAGRSRRTAVAAKCQMTIVCGTREPGPAAGPPGPVSAGSVMIAA